MPYKNNEDRRKHYKDNIERMRFEKNEQTRRRRKLCPPAYTHLKLKQIEYMRLLKLEVLTYYSNGKCACVQCGESRLACLSLDHMNGRNPEERKNKITGKSLYRKVKREDYPKGYQTLCMNCQWVKRCFNNETRWGDYGKTNGGATKQSIVEVLS